MDKKFQSTLPARGATLDGHGPRTDRNISIHTPREGSDCTRSAQSGWAARFQSTLPARGATIRNRALAEAKAISIHTPREGSDTISVDGVTATSVFQSTLPARGATRLISNSGRRKIFQSTLPARGATKIFTRASTSLINFNPHSPRGERQKSTLRRGCLLYFNPHSPRGERPSNSKSNANGSGYFNPHSPRGERRDAAAKAFEKHLFQSTLPARGATDAEAELAEAKNISIHTPREGSDKAGAESNENDTNFNPHSPRGERPRIAPTCRSRTSFQSTLPARGATVSDGLYRIVQSISIHTPREGSDLES